MLPSATSQRFQRAVVARLKKLGCVVSGDAFTYSSRKDHDSSGNGMQFRPSARADYWLKTFCFPGSASPPQEDLIRSSSCCDFCRIRASSEHRSQTFLTVVLGQNYLVVWNVGCAVKGSRRRHRKVRNPFLLRPFPPFPKMPSFRGSHF